MCGRQWIIFGWMSNFRQKYNVRMWCLNSGHGSKHISRRWLILVKIHSFFFLSESDFGDPNRLFLSTEWYVGECDWQNISGLFDMSKYENSSEMMLEADFASWPVPLKVSRETLKRIDMPRPLSIRQCPGQWNRYSPKTPGEYVKWMRYLQNVQHSVLCDYTSVTFPLLVNVKHEMGIRISVHSFEIENCLLSKWSSTRRLSRKIWWKRR